MSTPRRVGLPADVTAVPVRTPRGTFASLQAGDAAVATVVLLVPGWTGSKEDFATLLPELASRGLRAVAVDPRGQFETPGPADPYAYTMPELVADVRAVAQAVSAAPVHLVGHSFGGLVAAEVALADPELSSLTLLGSGPGTLPDDQRAGLETARETLEEHGLARTWEALQRHERASGVPAPPPDVDEWLRRRFLAGSATALLARTRHLLDAPDRTDDLARRPVPVLVVAGEHDDRWPPAAQAAMAAAIGAPYREIPGAGHSPAVDDPAATAAQISAFVDRWPAPLRLSTTTLGAGSEQVPAVRRRVRECLQTLPAAVVDDTELVASELVTNALLHGTAPVSVDVTLRGSTVQVSVSDAGPRCLGTDTHRPHHGRGLAIVAALAQRTGGWQDPDGCHVWAQLASPSGSRPAHGAAAGTAAAPSGQAAR